MMSGAEAAAKAAVWVVKFQEVNPDVDLHTIHLVANGQHGGWDLVIEGSYEDDNGNVETTQERFKVI
jgi:hypothetical protein